MEAQEPKKQGCSWGVSFREPLFGFAQRETRGKPQVWGDLFQWEFWPGRSMLLSAQRTWKQEVITFWDFGGNGSVFFGDFPKMAGFLLVSR